MIDDVCCHQIITMEMKDMLNIISYLGIVIMTFIGIPGMFIGQCKLMSVKTLPQSIVWVCAVPYTRWHRPYIISDPNDMIMKSACTLLLGELLSPSSNVYFHVCIWDCKNVPSWLTCFLPIIHMADLVSLWNTVYKSSWG